MVRILSRVVLASAIVLTSTCTQVMTVAAQTHDADASSSITPEATQVIDLPYERRIRAELGFENDEPYLASLAQRFDTEDSIGFRATPSEVAELKRRMVLSDLMPRLWKQLQYPGIGTIENDSTFSGVWLDQKAGGVVTVDYTQAPTNVQVAIIKAAVPAGTALDFQVVHFNVAALEEALALISSEMSSHIAPVEINYAAVDPAANRVIISIPSDLDYSKSVADLVARYGPEITVRAEKRYQAADARDVRSGPLYGGEWITNTTRGGSCTVAYAGLKSTSGVPYAITAGHCAKLSNGFYSRTRRFTRNRRGN